MSFTSRLISACSVTSFTGQYSLENLCCKRFSTLYRTGNGKQQRITGKKKRQTTIIKKLYFPTFHGGCYKLLIFFSAATLQPQPDMLGECKGVPSLHHIYIFFVYWCHSTFWQDSNGPNTSEQEVKHWVKKNVTRTHQIIKREEMGSLFRNKLRCYPQQLESLCVFAI